MDPLSRGRECYKKKDYKGALEAFNEVVNCSTEHILLTSLDHRAATFEKLGLLQSALKDAKHMIDQKPELAKGYLRCAKVLRLKGDDNLALKIYERGLKKVRVGEDPDRLLLQQMFNKLQAKEAPSKCFDPLVMLPNELAKMVCEYLSMRDLVVCLAVSQPWKRFLEASHDLWTELDFRHTKRLIRLDSLKAHLRRCNYKLDRAVINMNRSVFSAKYLDYITKTCKDLEYVELLSVGFLGDSLLAALPAARSLRALIIKGSQMTLHSVVEALTICPQLESFECDSFKLAHWIYPKWPQLDSLRSLKLESWGSSDIDPMQLDSLMSCTPNLCSATLIHTRHGTGPPHYRRNLDFMKWDKLEHLEFRNSSLIRYPHLPETLKYLDISGTRMVARTPTVLSEEEEIAVENLRGLETFICEGSVNVDLEAIYKIIEQSRKAGNLKTLRIGDGLDSDEFPYHSAEYSIPSLRTLGLTKWLAPEEQLLIFLRHCPAIENLDVSSTKITGVAVKELMTRDTGPLKWLRLNECTKLSPDAVDYARSLGAEVEYSIASEWANRKASWRDRRPASGL